MKKKNKKAGCLISVVWALALVFTFIILLPKEKTDGDISSKDGQFSEVESEAETETATEPEEKPVYEDDTVSVSFVSLYEVEYVDGVAYLQLIVENKSDERIWVYLENGSVNGYTIMYGSGTPMYINPGEKSKNPFIVPLGNTDAKCLDDIKEIKFSIGVRNEETNEVLVTTEIFGMSFE